MPNPSLAARVISPIPRLVTLPKNLLLSPGTLYEDFETIGDWTIASGSAAANTTAGQFKTGTQSIKLTSNAGAIATMTKTVNWDLSGAWGMMDVWVYLHNTTLSDYGANLQIQLANDSGLSNIMRVGLATNEFHNSGWYHYYFPKSYFGAVGTGTFSSPIIRVRCQVKGATSIVAVASFDSLNFGLKAKPAVALILWDGYASAYTQAINYLVPRGLRATVMCQTNGMGTGAYMTWAQIQTLNAAGFCIANHTNSSAVLSGASEATQEAQILGGKNDLIANGLIRGNNIVGFPNGTSDANTITALTNLGAVLGVNGDQSSVLWDGTSYCAMALPPGNTYQFGGQNITNSKDQAFMQSLIDEAITGGTIVPEGVHELGASGTLPVPIAQYQGFIDYVYAKKKAGLITDVTYDDIVNLSLGPVTVPA